MKITKRDRAQLARCVSLLERVRYSGTEQERDDDSHHCYHAGVAIYALEDLLEALDDEDRSREVDQMAASLESACERLAKAL